ncbi:transposase-like protein [Streptomyces sp. TE5632]
MCRQSSTIRPARSPTHQHRATGPRRRHTKRHPFVVAIVQIFPNPDALERLTTAVLIEMHDEWTASPRRHLPEGSMDKIYPDEDQPDAFAPRQGT